MQMSGFIALFVGLVASRIVHERGYATLSAEEKVRLMDGFSNSRKYSMIPLLILLCGYFLLIKQVQINHTIVMTSYFALLGIYIAGLTVWNLRRLRSLELPATYRKYFTLSQAISLCGVTWLMFTILWESPPV